MSGFSSLNIASNVLSAHQRALEVTAQNVANAATVGYTRQRADLQSLSATSVSGLYSTSEGVGEGVSADVVTRIRDAFLERRGQLEHGISAQAAAVDVAWSQAELSFNEPGSSGLQATLTKQWSAWGQLATTPTDPAARTAVVAASQAVVSSLNSTAKALDAQWSSTRVDLQDGLGEVNAAARQIADLNRAIVASTAGGLDSNELQDKRDVLIGTLADRIGAIGVPKADGSVDVVVNGAALVAGKTASQITLSAPTAPSGATTATSALSLAPGGAAVTPGGTMGGQLQAMNEILPGLQGRLDAVAADVAARVNAAQQDGSTAAGVRGQALFQTEAGSTTGITAGNIRLSGVSGSGLATGLLDADGNAYASSSGANADRIAQLGSSTTGPDATYRDLVTDLGVKAQSATSSAASARAIVTQVDASRQSVSGVSLDEEMTNMLVFKQSYAAISRVITAIDEMLDVLINKTGLVGR
ncbi:hypothetical protein ASG36_04710 [Geodermatophilus sp. Leaf369]|uniref:flagellar hook-associated protein FlgK n=1 Tax=Geodermatophilus sp. Leaf369 TaxID=1736354 RepID=UPI0006FA6464|nr:flagellar hook-associated protein FlgK [Geodermatophilus sp. Leaf369]KQS60271.1 hypothetical protein ASG36_04710 [Geodermatophilus sp. Leaf369]QNG37666.1 flagellar hook-associated protein FlgK [Geodermatophilaceae bacterium NBWT11]